MWISPTGKAAIGYFIKWNDKCFEVITHADAHMHDYSLVDSFTINFRWKAQTHCQITLFMLFTLWHIRNSLCFLCSNKKSCIHIYRRNVIWIKKTHAQRSHTHIQNKVYISVKSAATSVHFFLLYYCFSYFLPQELVMIQEGSAKSCIVYYVTVTVTLYNLYL